MPLLKFQPCIPTRGTKVPAGPNWLHEVKHDGFRMIVQRESDRVRLFTRNGHDWSSRYPWIVESALRNRTKQFVIDGETVILSRLTVTPTSTPCTGRNDGQVQFYAFDILGLGGSDLRGMPLSMRKTNLARLLAGRSDGICIASYEQAEIGPDLLRKACEFGLEGIVSKRQDRPYRGGRSPHWIKVKNPDSPAMTRAKEVEWSNTRTAKR
jgi:ATP-dependent DNA ligase